MEEEALNQLIQDYEGLFYKVLQRCGIFPGQADYEDHLQELRLAFYLRAKTYPSRGHFEMANEITYLFRHLLWRMVDLKRKKAIVIEETSEERLNYLPDEGTEWEELAIQDQFQRFYGQLSPKDQKKCQDLIEEESLSRQARSRYRQYFRKHFQTFF
ncbi:RNA polymerase sigma factor [Enterococcus sp. LJL98]